MNNTIYRAIKKKLSRLHEITFYFLDDCESLDDLYKARHKWTCLFEEISKIIEHFRNNYKSPEITEISPCDCGITGYYIVSCWLGSYEIYSQFTREEKLAHDKKDYLDYLHSLQGQIDCYHNLLTEKGILV